MSIFVIGTKNNKIIIFKNLETSFPLSELVLTSPFIKGGYMCFSMPLSEQWRLVSLEVHCKRWLRQLQCRSPAAPSLVIWAVWQQCTWWAAAWPPGAVFRWVMMKKKEGSCLFLGWRTPHPSSDVLFQRFQNIRAGTQEDDQLGRTEGDYLSFLTEAEDIKKRWQEYTENCTKNIFMTQIITMVWSLT